MKRIIIFIFLFFLIPFFVLAQEPEQFKTDDGETLFFTRAGSGPKVILLCG